MMHLKAGILSTRNLIAVVQYGSPPKQAADRDDSSGHLSVHTLPGLMRSKRGGGERLHQVLQQFIPVLGALKDSKMGLLSPHLHPAQRTRTQVGYAARQYQVWYSQMYPVAHLMQWN